MPATYDLFFTALVILTVLPLGIALVKWFKDPIPGLARPLRLLAIVILPIVGPLAYLAKGGAKRQT